MESPWRFALFCSVAYRSGIATVKFTKRQHHAVTRGTGMTCHWIRPVAAPCNVLGGSGMTCHGIRPNVHHIGIVHQVSISTTSPQLTCHSASVSEILSKSDHPRQIFAILDFRGPVMGYLKSPYTTSYRSSIETIALNCFVFEKIAFFVFLRQTDKQTDRRTDGQHRCTKPLSLSRAAA